MNSVKRFICIGLVFVMAFICGAVANAEVVTEHLSDDLMQELPPYTEAAAGVVPLDLPVKSAILMEVNTGKILYEQNSHEKLAPASITKVMSLLLVMEAIKSGSLTTETVISASEHACSMGGSQIWLEPNEEMTVHDLLKAAVVGSANDATVALGEAIAGSEEGFVALMNERAKQLGLEDTCFVNATGLDADGHLTSAHDIAVTSAELIKYDLIKEYSTIWMDSLRGGQSELVNTNKLVRFYEGCTGLKTGTTSQAGCCLSATAERDGLEVVAVVMGAANSNDRFDSARKLLDYAFANFAFKEVTVDQQYLVPIAVKKGIYDAVSTYASDTGSVLLEKKNFGDISVAVELNPYLEAPVFEGQQVGIARIMRGDEEVGNIKIFAKEYVPKMTFLMAFWQLLKNCFY